MNQRPFGMAPQGIRTRSTSVTKQETKVEGLIARLLQIDAADKGHLIDQYLLQGGAEAERAGLIIARLSGLYEPRNATVAFVYAAQSTDPTETIQAKSVIVGGGENLKATSCGNNTSEYSGATVLRLQNPSEFDGIVTLELFVGAASTTFTFRKQLALT